jgi:hypothetical protein
MKKFFTIMLLLVICNFSIATTYTSASNGSWSSSSTWNPSGVPGAGDEVIINHAITAATVNALDVEIGTSGSLDVSNKLTVYGTTLDNDGSFSCNHLEMTGSVSASTYGNITVLDFTMDKTGGLILYGALNVKGALDLEKGTIYTNNILGGSLTLKNDGVTTHGRISSVGTSGSIVGDYTAEFLWYIGENTFNPPVSGPANADWAYVGSPFDHTISDWNLTTSGFSGSDYPSFPFTNVYHWNESNQSWEAPNDINDPISRGEGFSAYDYIYNYGTYQQSFTGSTDFNTAFTLNYSAGWNCIANPYPGAINLADIADLSGAGDGNFHIWNGDIGSYEVFNYFWGFPFGATDYYLAEGQALWFNALAPGNISIPKTAIVDQIVAMNKTGGSGCVSTQPNNSISFWTSDHCAASYIMLDEGSGYHPYNWGGIADCEMKFAMGEEGTSIGKSYVSGYNQGNYKIKTSDVSWGWKTTYVRMMDPTETLYYQRNASTTNYDIEYWDEQNSTWNMLFYNSISTINPSQYITNLPEDSYGMQMTVPIRYRKSRSINSGPKSVTITPNPGKTGQSSNMTLSDGEYPEFDEVITYTIVDMSGKVIKSGNAGTDLEFSYEGVSEGIYILNVTGNKGFLQTEKITIK